ncbi:uncharacterized protein LOC143425063 [Xylocopa sonorina]|uniref:uncharacterized protein LOC143425063 n=1 Tax=Xylocopa sonorina TaxID=1818115 RepID=UPI00403AA07D
MLELFKLNMDKFAHIFIENLGLRIKSHTCRKVTTNKITFIWHIDESDSVEKMKEVSVQQSLDFSNEKSINHFLETHASLFDKLSYFDNTNMFTSHLKNINAKILEKMKAKSRRNSEDMRKGKAKLRKVNIICSKKLRRNISYKLNGLKKNSLSSVACKEINSQNYKKDTFKKVPPLDWSKIFSRNIIIPNGHKIVNNLNTDNIKHNSFVVKHNLANNLTNIAKEEVKNTDKYVQLHTKDIEHVKRNVQVTLHIAQNLNYDYSARKQVDYNLALCRHAILCLIEPSKKAIVSIEDDLSIVIQSYLSRGYKYHFEFQSCSKEYYAAVLILSQWAKVLVKHINTTMIYTICGVLGCDVKNILVLYNPGRK